MATQKDFRIKNGLQVRGGNIVTTEGSLNLVDQISGDTGQIIINNGQLGNSFMRLGLIGGGDANSFIRTDRTLEFHIGQSATTATPSVSIDTSHNLNIKGNFQIDGVNRIVATSSYTEFRNPQGVTKLWLGGGSDGTADPSAYINGNNFWIRDFNSTVNSVFSSSGLDIKRGDLKLNATTVINSSRNLVNIGSISASGVIKSSGGDTATSGQLLNLSGSSVNQTNSGTIRLTESSYNSSPFFQGGFIKYDGSGNQLKIGTHSASDSNLANDIDAITIARSTGDTTFGQIIQSNRDIRSAGQIRATGWYNATASTDYTGMALEIGVSGTQPHILAYNRATATYGAMVMSSAGLTINPRSNDVTIQGVVNLTSSGHLEINSTTVIDSPRNLTIIGIISNSAFTIPNSIGTAGQVV